MGLLNDILLKRFAEVGRQDEVEDPAVIAHFFNPAGVGDWYATEFYPEDRSFFGYVSIFGDHNDEWGYFALSELESHKGVFGIRIERDLYWQEKPFSQVRV